MIKCEKIGGGGYQALCCRRWYPAEIPPDRSGTGRQGKKCSRNRELDTDINESAPRRFGPDVNRGLPDEEGARTGMKAGYLSEGRGIVINARPHIICIIAPVSSA